MTIVRILNQDFFLSRLVCDATRGDGDGSSNGDGDKTRSNHPHKSNLANATAISTTIITFAAAGGEGSSHVPTTIPPGHKCRRGDGA